MSGVINDILEEDGDDETVEESFQDDFKTEIKTRRKNFEKWICIDDIEYDN